MDRISTSSAYSQVLNNLLLAEVNQTTAGNQLSSSEKATNLEGYGADAESLTAMQAVNTQVTGYLNDTTTVSAKLGAQDAGLNEVATSAGTAIQAITQALSSNNGANLMQSLQDAFGSAVEGLNTTYNGEYVFAGGQVNTQPVTINSLAQLPAPPASVGSVFNNDQRQITSQIDQNTTIATGFLASNVGTPLFQAFQAIQAYDTGPNGPLSGTLTSTQEAWLTGELSTLNGVQTTLNNTVAQNGQMQDEVTSVQNDLGSRQSMLQGLISNTTSADVAQATTNLQQAQLAVQAAGQVLQSLNSSSLLNYMSSSGTIG